MTFTDTINRDLKPNKILTLDDLKTEKSSINVKSSTMKKSVQCTEIIYIYIYILFFIRFKIIKLIF